MTVNEFSDGFDVLYNNVMSNQAPGLDEYEKSFFLTKAQDEILKNYFNPKGNKYQEGIDDNPKRQIDFSMVLKVGKGISINKDDTTIEYTPLDESSLLYELPNDIFIILNERMKSNNRPILVIPINHSEYDKYSMKPYPYPTKNSTWRILGYGTKEADKVFVGEIIKAPCTGEISSYTIRYVKQPQPIILGHLSCASIGGLNTVSECELDPILHQEILQRAVELAKAAYVGDINSMVEMGKRSE